LTIVALNPFSDNKRFALFWEKLRSGTWPKVTENDLKRKYRNIFNRLTTARQIDLFLGSPSFYRVLATRSMETNEEPFQKVLLRGHLET